MSARNHAASDNPAQPETNAQAEGNTLRQAKRSPKPGACSLGFGAGCVLTGDALGRFRCTVEALVASGVANLSDSFSLPSRSAQSCAVVLASACKATDRDESYCYVTDGAIV